MSFQVYTDGGRLVTEGSSYGPMAAECLSEMARGRHSCGVYQPHSDGLMALYEMWRDDRGRVHQWHRVGDDIPTDGSIPGTSLVQLFSELADRHRGLVRQMRKSQSRLKELDQYTDTRTGESAQFEEERETCRESIRVDSLVAMTLRDVGRMIIGIGPAESDENPFDPGQENF